MFSRTGRTGEAGVETGMSMKSTPTAKMRLAFLEAARPMLVFGILGNEAGFLWRREGKEKFLRASRPVKP